MKNPLIIIEVYKGLVHSVSSTHALNYIVVDHDNNVRIEGYKEPDHVDPNVATIFVDDLRIKIQQIIDRINDKDYPNKRTFFVKDESGREFSGNFTTAQLLTLRDPDEEDMNGERLFEYAEEAQPGDEWHAWGVKITCIE